VRFLFALILPLTLFSQTECSPFFSVNTYQTNDDVLFSIGYISCIHARGVNYEIGTKDMQIGTILMGKNHHNSAYIYTQYTQDFDSFRVYVGPIYRLNNDPVLGIVRLGSDVQIYESVYLTLSLLQMNPDLSYLYFGLKLIM
jgi:hypothetical protein